MFYNKPNQPSNFDQKTWVEINDDVCETYNINSQITFKTTMLMSSLWNYSDAYILVKGTVTVPKTAAAQAAANNGNKKSKIKKFYSIYW